MEAKALTTDTWTVPEDPETAEPAASQPPDGEQADGQRPDGEQPHPSSDAKTFRDLGIAEPICAALEAAGITTTFPIQELALPIALDRHDLIGQARTGTGKTLAFGIPILQHLSETPGGTPSAPRALVVVPTRELAMQVADDIRTAGSRTGARVVTLYGGRAYEPQIEALANVDIVVGTPGRLLDLCKQRHLDLSEVQALVLDEADKMLDLGFLPDVEAILRLTPQQRQTMLFSATMPGEVVTLARRHLSQPMHIRAEHSGEPVLVPSTEQHVFRVHQMDKIELLARLLQAEGRGLTIVFCRTRRACDTVTTALTQRGFAAGAVHGDLGQSQRERAMRAFRSGKVDVLVATDVAARGLDVEDVTHVVNHECPEDEKAFLHRIGRTGRAGRDGVAVTFVDWHDLQRWKLINTALDLGHPEPPETYSTSAHLFHELGIPPQVTGVLPRAQRDRLGLHAEELEDIGETGRVRSGSAGRPGRQNDRDQPASLHRKRPRRRTRSGQPVGQGGQPVPGGDGPPASGGQPGRRSQGGRGQNGGASQNSAASQNGQGDGDTGTTGTTGTTGRPGRRRRRGPRGKARQGQGAAPAAAAAPAVPSTEEG